MELLRISVTHGAHENWLDSGDIWLWPWELVLLHRDRGAGYCDQPVCLSVCLWAYRWNRWTDLHEILYADPLWSWLHYVLPVLWMTSRLAVGASWSSRHSALWSTVHPVALRDVTRAESDVFECIVGSFRWEHCLSTWNLLVNLDCDKSNFTCIFIKNTHKFDKLTRSVLCSRKQEEIIVLPHAG